jgi:hypothetical protein
MILQSCCLLLRECVNEWVVVVAFQIAAVLLVSHAAVVNEVCNVYGKAEGLWKYI